MIVCWRQQLEKLYTEPAGVGAEQDREKPLPLIAGIGKAKAYRGSTRMNANQNPKAKT